MAIGVAFMGVALVRCRGSVRRPRVALEMPLILVAALLFRLPALLHPWGLVNRDGAYGAFVALHILAGQRPAPVFTEGANYQGTLKAHLAAFLSLVTGSRDLSLLLTIVSLILTLVFIGATMALARRIAGRPAAVATGLYLALGPKFVTIFTLNCVGQYADVLALGGLALALTARLLDEDSRGPKARGSYLAVGLLLGAAFWQQPVASSYGVAVGLALAMRRATWRDPWALLAPLGATLGALPAILWNLGNAWASRDIVGGDPDLLRGQVEALPTLVARTLNVAFPILSGLSPGHPWAKWPFVAFLATILIPALLLGFLMLTGRRMGTGLRAGRPGSAFLPPALLLACLAAFWAVASGHILTRPRYLLPVAAATAVHLGVVAAWAWQKSRFLAGLAVGVLIAFGAVGTTPRLRQCARVAATYEDLVRSLQQKGIRTGYADFSIAAPVTMFTAEGIVLSPRLGPTPAYESDVQERRVLAYGPDAFVLRRGDDSEAFATALDRLGVAYRFDPEPVPVFYELSRKVAVEEVRGIVAEAESGTDE